MIFDEIEKEETKSSFGILFNLSNIILLIVIGISVFLFIKVEKISPGKRLD